MITIVYAVIGIPLTFLYLSNIGNFMADCFRLFYKRVCCDVCCCQQCARKHKNVKRRRRRETANQRNEVVDGVRPEPEKLAVVPIGAADGRRSATQPSNADERPLSADVWRPTAEYCTSGFVFANIRETDIIDDETSVSRSTSQNDLRDVDAGRDSSRAGCADDETRRRRLLTDFLDAKETDIVSDRASSATAQRCCGNRSFENSKHPAVQSRVNAPPTAATGSKVADNTEAKLPTSSARTGPLGRLKTITSAHEGSKVKKSSRVQKSKSFSQADESTNRVLALRIFSRNECSAAPGIPVRSAIDSCSVAGSRYAAHSTLQSADVSRLGLTRDCAKSARKDGKDVCAAKGRKEDRKRKLLRSHSTKLSKMERVTLRRNATLTEMGGMVGGPTAGDRTRKLRRQATAIQPLDRSSRLQRQDSVNSASPPVGNDLGESQDSFVTAHGDSMFYLDSEAPGRSSADRLRASDDDDDDDVVSMSCNKFERRSSISANSYRCDKCGGGASIPASDGHGPIVFRTEAAPDHEDDVKVLGHVAEAKVSVPISVCLVIIALYIFAGSFLFAAWENWGLLTGCYFCFITLSTIGFGDVVPGTDMYQWSSHGKLVLCVLWLAFGLSLLAMCFNLMQEEVKQKCKWIGRKLGLLKAES